VVPKHVEPAVRRVGRERLRERPLVDGAGIRLEEAGRDERLEDEPAAEINAAGGSRSDRTQRVRIRESATHP
jgi:hypothetical protein